MVRMVVLFALHVLLGPTPRDVRAVGRQKRIKELFRIPFEADLGERLVADADDHAVVLLVDDDGERRRRRLARGREQSENGRNPTPHRSPRRRSEEPR
jgi:hypothetical protein